jgi:1,4-dihydroxy-2-naphthoate octaprenyltransferase
MFILLTTISLQIVSNLANDLYDFEKGADNSERIGPERTLQSGAVSAETMKQWLQWSIVFSLVFGLVMLTLAPIFIHQKLGLIALGLASIWAAVHYTKGKKAYGYRAQGELFVFIFFGLVGILGQIYLYTRFVNLCDFLLAVSFGFLACSILLLNNLRDHKNDAQVGKKTLVHIIGLENSRLLFVLLLILAILLWGIYPAFQTITTTTSFLYYIGFFCLIYVILRFIKIQEDSNYDLLFKPLGIGILITSVLFFLSQLL